MVTVGCKTVGIGADGSLMRSFLGDARQRWERGEKPRGSRDAALSQARACLMLLRHDDSLITLPLADAADDDATPEWDGRYVFVRSFKGEDACLKRHAATRTSMPPFPATLNPMLQKLQHGGPHSFEIEGHYAVDMENGRCECLGSTYNGVTSSKGECKHTRYARLALPIFGDVSEDEVGEVRRDALISLRTLVRRREATKPATVRCKALYDASADSQDAARLLAALSEHNSVPPTGRADGGLAGESAFEDGAEDEGMLSPPLAGLELPTEAAEKILSCTFDSTDLGVSVVERADAYGLPSIVVAGFGQLSNGEPGPARCSGERLHAGDVIIGVEGLADISVAESRLDLKTLDANAPVVVRFVRQRLRARTPRSKARKPTPTRASHRQALEVPAGSAGASAAEQVAALREQLLSAAHRRLPRNANASAPSAHHAGPKACWIRASWPGAMRLKEVGRFSVAHNKAFVAAVGHGLRRNALSRGCNNEGRCRRLLRCDGARVARVTGIRSVMRTSRAPAPPSWRTSARASPRSSAPWTTTSPAQKGGEGRERLWPRERGSDCGMR
mmetsp:Transcript_51814/g.171666  ORF Transcript_51814/g.171666 Transcript_51814/m.171666 type:complete len:562 (+) Transcript_51814:547-2232(+)